MSGDVEALAEVLLHGPRQARRPHTMEGARLLAEHVLASPWLAAHVAAARAEEREACIRVIEKHASSEVTRTEWDGSPGLLGNWVGGIRDGATILRALLPVTESRDGDGT